MGRLIDADKALEVVRDQGLAHPNAYHLTNYATLILREAPTVDAVEIVRCRDCKYWCKSTRICCLDGPDTVWYANNFCSYGERKDGEAE